MTGTGPRSDELIQLGEAVRQFRLQRGLTQRDIVRKDSRTVSELERGLRLPRAEFFERYIELGADRRMINRMYAKASSAEAALMRERPRPRLSGEEWHLWASEADKQSYWEDLTLLQRLSEIRSATHERVDVVSCGSENREYFYQSFYASNAVWEHRSRLIGGKSKAMVLTVTSTGNSIWVPPGRSFGAILDSDGNVPPSVEYPEGEWLTVGGKGAKMVGSSTSRFDEYGEAGKASWKRAGCPQIADFGPDDFPIDDIHFGLAAQK